MATSEIITKFNFSYGELFQQSIEKQTYALRDVAELTPRGITAARITAFGGLSLIL